MSYTHNNHNNHIHNANNHNKTHNNKDEIKSDNGEAWVSYFGGRGVIAKFNPGCCVWVRPF